MMTTGLSTIRIAFVFEYARDNNDWMFGSLIESLGARLPGLQSTCIHGVFPTYRPGGLRAGRIVNLVWVYLQVVLHLTFFHHDAVLVRSAPPGVQLWTMWWARFRRVPVLCWMMDCHPEIEARKLERLGFTGTARFLRGMDASLMPRFSVIVALDKAMADFVRSRAAGVEVLEHPTWNAGEAAGMQPVSYRPGSGAGPLRLAYSGNLGTAHDLSAFSGLLDQLARRRPVELHVIGSSAAGEARFLELGSKPGVSIKTNPRVSFAELRGLYERWKIDAGVVLLAGESCGVVSPSKFLGYIDFGVPLVYLGPPATSTAEVCTRFGGGFWMPVRAGSRDSKAVADSLLDVGRMRDAAKGARAAAAHFAGLNADSLADMLLPRLERLPGIAAAMQYRQNGRQVAS